VTKQISSLVSDIYSTVQRKDGWLTNSLASDLGKHLSERLVEQFAPRSGKGTLRLSKMGDQCPRALWYSVHYPELAEKVPGHTEIKFYYGHILECLVLPLAKAAGHEVVGEQDAVSVDSIVGHRDAIVDGCLVDVKSASGRSFEKFRDGSIKMDDPFGYLSQLDGYVVGSLDDPLLRVKDRAYILAIHKELGHLCLYEHRVREDHIRHRIASYKQIVERSSPPACTCGTVADGESGNVKLDMRASYSPYKHCCFPNLRTCIGSGDKPRYFTTVVKWPKFQGVPLMEVDRHGNRI
jgi:hypothetical protein